MPLLHQPGFASDLCLKAKTIICFFFYFFFQGTTVKGITHGVCVIVDVYFILFFLF